MIHDIYSRSAEESKYSENVIEVSEPLSQLILKIENTLFTRKGDVLGVPDFGCNLEDLVFSIVFNESVIEQKINSQIQAYCLPNENNFTINTKVKFFTADGRNGALIDIYVNEQRVIGALF
jgi:phage baseplate assembly protein W